MSKNNNIIAAILENGNQISVLLKKQSDRYLDEFVRLSCAPDLLTLKIYPNAKEITESMAAFAAIRKVVGADKFGDSSIKLFSVGDGSIPRTAALFAFMTRWQSVSIDPNVKVKGRYSKVARLSLFPGRVEDFIPEPSETLNVIVAVHSHAKFHILWDKLVAGEFPDYFDVEPSDIPALTWEAIDKELKRRGGPNWESTL